MNNILSIIIGFWIVVLPFVSQASVTIDFQAAELKSFGGSPAPVGSRAILVVDTDGSGFVGDYIDGSPDFGAFDGLDFSIGSTIGSSTNRILQSMTVGDLGGEIFGVSSVLNFNLESGIDTGDALALYWFPEILSSTITGTLFEYGFFRSDVIDPFATSAFFIPSDGSSESIYAFSADIGGSTPASALTAMAIPEPSTYAALFGGAAVALIWMRRRRRKVVEPTVPGSTV